MVGVLTTIAQLPRQHLRAETLPIIAAPYKMSGKYHLISYVNRFSRVSDPGIQRLKVGGNDGTEETIAAQEIGGTLGGTSEQKRDDHRGRLIRRRLYTKAI